MKTIADAHKELKGDLNNTKGFKGDEGSLDYLKGQGRYICTYGTSQTDTDLHQYICTTEEFNNYMPEVKSVVEDKISCFVCHVGAFPMQQYCGSCGHELLSENHEPITPVFTQDMVDQNILPSVGMKVHFLKEVCVYTVMLGADKEGDLILSPDDGDYWQRAHKSDVKPLTPPIELEDGKAYQFDHKDLGGINGIYDDNGKVLWSGGTPCHIGYCTNIHLLTVE